MRRIAILNQKGGVGKTTTTVNLSAALANAGRRVCVLDLDPQAHATTHLGLEPDGTLPSLYDVLVNSRPLADVRREADANLWLCPSDINLAAAEVELAGVVGREVILREALSHDSADFDFMLMDCGPSLGVLTLNALASADEFPSTSRLRSARKVGTASCWPHSQSTFAPAWPSFLTGVIA